MALAHRGRGLILSRDVLLSSEESQPSQGPGFKAR
jgi:hypothetical protein